MRGIKDYLVFGSLPYKLMVFLCVPIFILVIHAAIAIRYGVNFNVYVMLSTIMLEIMADNWLLGGIHNKDAEKMDFIKSSKRGKSVLRNVLIVDLVRRIILQLFLVAGVSVINIIVLGKNSVVDIKDYYLIMLFYVEIDYILGVIGTFITRFINNFWVSSMIGYVLYVIGFALAFIVMIKGIKWFVIPFLLILAIIVSIGIVVFGMKKLEESSYDR